MQPRTTNNYLKASVTRVEIKFLLIARQTVVVSLDEINPIYSRTGNYYDIYYLVHLECVIYDRGQDQCHQHQ